MKVEPKYSNVGQVFNTENLFTIPKYQRPYSWEEEHIKDFLNDITLCYDIKERDHFLGAIVTIETKITGTNKSRYEVIDGQQRLTTLSLFAFALLNYYKDIQKKLAEHITDFKSCSLWEPLEISIKELTEQYIRLKFTNNGSVEEILKLTPSNADYDFYSSFLLSLTYTGMRNSNTKIENAYNILYNFIDDLINYNNFLPIEVTVDLLTKKYNDLGRIINILNEKLFLLNVVTQNRSDAYKLFQTLNNRGLNLNVADLLKARTLELLDKFPKYQEIAEKTWINLADNSNIVDFLTTVYFYETGSSPNKNNLYEVLLNQFFPDTIASEYDAKKICEKINSLSSLYKNYSLIIEGRWPYDNTENSVISEWSKNRLYILIKKLKHTQCIPLLLHASNKSEDVFLNYVHLTERFFFRAKIIYALHASSLTKLYSTACKNFFKDHKYNFSNYKTAIIEFSNSKTPNEKFNENIDINLHYKKSGGNTDLKYLFSLINDYYDFCKKAIIQKKQFIKLNTECCQITDFDLLSIEHISSQNSSDDFDTKLLHKLGNLTILPQKLNVSIGNNDYLKKKPYITSTTFKLNSYFKNVDNWNKISYEARHSTIIEHSQVLFDLNR